MSIQEEIQAKLLEQKSNIIRGFVEVNPLGELEKGGESSG